MQCGTKNGAMKRYTTRMAWTMVVYLIVTFVTTWVVRHTGVAGWLLYLMAVLPCLPILRLLQVMALYLREEQDEYLRLLVVRSCLWAAGAVLAVSSFDDFVRSYTHSKGLPPFTLFLVFWVVQGVAQGVQSVINRAGSDE